MKIVYIGVPIIVIASAVATAPYFIGQQTEQRFRSAVAEAEVQLSSPIEIERYDRGWLSSTARTTVTISLGEGRTFDVVLDHDISHGPWPSLDFGQIVTTVHQTDTEKSNGLAKLFDGPYLTITTELPLSGGYTISLDSPKAQESVSDEYANVRMDWQGLHAIVVGRDEDVIQSVDIQAPGLTLEQPSGEIMRISTYSVRSPIADAIRPLPLHRHGASRRNARNCVNSNGSSVRLATRARTIASPVSRPK
jgi:hypothetical protein